MGKIISQKRFLRGLNASFSILAQPDGTLPRMSNLLMSNRGALQTCDGSKTIAQFITNSDPTIGKCQMIAELFLFMPAGANRAYFALVKDPYHQLGAPVGAAVVLGAAGGTLAAATYFYKVTANDGAGGETLESAEVNVVNAGAFKNVLTWTALTNAVTYNVYRSTAAGAEVLLKSNVSGTGYTDDGTDVPGTLVPPVVDTTQTTLLVKVPLAGDSAPLVSIAGANLIKTLPADNLPAPIDDDGGGGGSGGGGGGGVTAGSGGAGSTVSGGTVGNFSALPVILQFVNSMFICPGNGLSPYISDGTTAGTVVLTNTFTALYPIWQTAVTYLQGDLIQQNIAGTVYVFKAIQGGVSAAGAPAFSAVLNSTVTDNKIIWQNIGLASTSPPPRGAAHGIVYSGSLWVANTSPTVSADGLDGPSALRMCDLNAPTSWNPLNSAMISRDDGGQINGLASYTIAEQGISPTGSLLVFKDFASYQVTGVFGSTNFAIQQLKTDMGCIAPRSILFLPGFGVVRLTHLGFAITDGVRDKVISEDIRPYIFGDPSDPDITQMDWNFAWFSKAAQCADPPMYMCATPVIGGVTLPSIVGASFNSVASGGVLYSEGPWYAKLSLVGPMWESAISPEMGPLNCFLFHNLRVTAPGLPPAGSLGYRAYIYQIDAFGNKTNGYWKNIPRDSTFVDFMTLENSGYPPSGQIGALTRLFCYDLILKAWGIIDLPFAISAMRQFRSPGTRPITLVGGYDDSKIRRIQSDDRDWDGVPIDWNVQFRELYGEGASQEIYFRQVAIHGVGAAATTNTLQATVTYDQSDEESLPIGVAVMGNNHFEAQIDFMRLARMMHLAISGSGIVEIDSADFEVVPGQYGAPITIA